METNSTQNQLYTPSSRWGIFCWCLFDWAHSAFPTVIITFIFSAYFIRAVDKTVVTGTAHWGWSIGIAGVVVAIASPFLGAIADHTGRRKPWLACFVLLNIIFTALLFFTQPKVSWVCWGLTFVVLAEIAYELTQLFYNAMMVGITPKDKLGRISGWGWALGYIGGLACLVIALFLFIKAPWFSKLNDINVRSVTLLVALWFLVFAIPLFIFTPDLKRTDNSTLTACKKGLAELWETFKDAWQYKWIFLFLIAHLIYIDGLNTLFAFGGIFAAGTFHMDYIQILIFAMLLNITAAIGAAVFAFVDDWLGAKLTVCISLVCLMVVGVMILLIHSILWFWILAAILGIFVGPTQAASRSYMAHLAPENKINEMFGLYNFSGRITSFIGPILVGTFTEVFSSQRGGMAVIFVMLLIGFVLLLFVPKAITKNNSPT